MGQFFFDDEEIDRDFFRAQAKRYGFKEEEYMAVLDRVPRFSRETMENAMSFLVSLAGYLSEQGLANLRFARSNAENRRLLAEVSTREALQNLAGKLADLGWWVVDLETGTCTWSDEVCLIHERPTGFSPTVEQGISFYAPEYRDRIREVFSKCAKEGIPYDEELQIISGSGRRIWVRTMGVPEKDASGNIVRVLGGFQDISELKKAQEDLASSRERFDLFLNSSKDMAFLKDADMRLILANDAFLEFLGRAREGVIGRSDYELLPAPLAEQCARGDEEVLRRGKPLVFEEHGGDRIYETMKFPVKFRNGTSGVGGFVRDVTDLRKAEEALRESEERFRSLFENATIGLYRTSPDGRILMANPSVVKMLGYSSFEELARRDLSKDGFEPDYPREMFQQIMESEGEIIGLETAWTRRDGTVLFVRESARAVRGADGNTLYYEGTVEDITERKASEDALVRARQSTAG
jgi:PAS domain S-box-containing protein